MKIAVVGSGVSGLVSAYLLAAHAEVTLIEKDNRLGGHAHTAHLKQDGKIIPVDTGFMVFNPETYPHFCHLVDQLKLEVVKSPMTFSVYIPKVISFCSANNALFYPPQKLLSLSYWRLLFSIVRFNLTAKKFIKTQSSVSLSEFLIQHKFSESFKNHFLYPLLGSIWSTQPHKIAEFPAYETLHFMNNHRLLNIVHNAQWYTIKGGSIEYVTRLSEKFKARGGKILTGQAVTAIKRTKQAVQLSFGGQTQTFDKVVFATHANQALKILGPSATAAETKALSQFNYAPNHTVLHQDSNLMPPQKRLWAAWNYHANQSVAKPLISLTYNMNALQHIPETIPAFVTLNPEEPIDSKTIQGEFQYEHPHFDLNSRQGQRDLEALQGENHTFYAGAHLGYGFHEDGVNSAMAIVKKMNLDLQW